MSLKLFACGDIVNSLAKNDFADENLIRVIKSCDIGVCNLEAPIKHDHMKRIKKAGPCLYQPRESIKYLKEAGFNFVSLANNHIYDYGQCGLLETVQELEKNDVSFIGGGVSFEQAYRTKVIEKQGLKVGLIAACENEFGCLDEDKERGGYAWLFNCQIDDSVRDLSKECNYVVLVAHAGVENIYFPIKEWRDRYKRLCDLGVDVIIGHHPHVPQGYENYKDSLIFYSLGNFYFDMASSVNKSDDSYSIILEFDENKPISFEIIYHKKINRKTCMVHPNQVDFDVERLCQLIDYEYNARNNQISLELFADYYYEYYRTAAGAMPDKISLLNKIKWIIRKLIFYKKNKESQHLMLLHNIRIDSHRFLVQRALSLLTEHSS